MNNNPSIDPANNDTLAGSIQFAFSKLMQNINKSLPAKVISYDRDKNRAQVQILVSILTTDGEVISRQQLASVPVVVLGGGGFIINFPLKPGNLGWIDACDRDISLFLQAYDESPPNTTRMFSFSDSKFYPDVMTGFSISEDDEDNFVLQNLDGTVKIAMTSDRIKITAPMGLEVEGPLSATGGSFSVTGNMNLIGDLAVVGNITATGDITPHVP